MTITTKTHMIDGVRRVIVTETDETGYRRVISNKRAPAPPRTYTADEYESCF